MLNRWLVTLLFFGFVVANVKFRVGVETASDFCCGYTTQGSVSFFGALCDADSMKLCYFLFTGLGMLVK